MNDTLPRIHEAKQLRADAALSEDAIRAQLFPPRHQPQYASTDPEEQRRKSLLRWRGDCGKREQKRLQDRKRRSGVLYAAGCTVRETAAALGYKAHSHVHRYIHEYEAELVAIAEAETRLAESCSLPFCSEPLEAISKGNANPNRRRERSPQEPMSQRQRAFMGHLCDRLRIEADSAWLRYSKAEAGALIARLVVHVEGVKDAA